MKKALVFLAVIALLVPVAAPAAEKYVIDPGHTTVGFAVRHLGLTTVRGKFKDYAVDLMVDESDLTKSTVNVTIQAASVTTDNENRDGELKGDGFFDVEKFPTITFKSTKIEKKEDGYVVTGDLTMKGVTKEVTLDMNLMGPKAGRRGGKMMAVSCTGKINRLDYGITWSHSLDDGTLVVSNEVNLEIDGEFHTPPPDAGNK